MKTYEVEFILNVGCSVTVEAESPEDAVERVTQMSNWSYWMAWIATGNLSLPM